jgi:3-oxoacyl-[acyl-carrier protein] reductase
LKAVIITGASRGIGFALFEKYLLENFFVITISRKEFPQRKNHKHFVLDLERENNFAYIIDYIQENNLHFEQLINNAGLLINKKFEDLQQDDFNRSLAVNFIGPVMLIQSLLSVFAKNSHIVNISSMGAFQGSSKFSGLSAYSASKAALTVMTESLALELQTNHISVNCLCLGAVQTEMLEEAFPGYNAPIKPIEMAEYIYNFANNSHKVMTGKIIPVSLSTP